ncbi:MAG: 50S ribosomal protein L11 methyltransferase [Pseudomonadota bacterium]
MKKLWGKITVITDDRLYDVILGKLSLMFNVDGVHEEKISKTRTKLTVYTKDIKKLPVSNLIEYDPAIETRWKKYFKPKRVGEKIVIKPKWEKYKAKAGDVVVNINPGTAFGTGLHGTTRGVIISLQKILDEIKNKKGLSLLDAGTGSGILAITAHKLGIKDITAVDSDIEAVAIAKENVVLNSIRMDGIKIKHNGIEKQNGTYNIVLANIVSGVLIAQRRRISSLIKPGGYVILSGILRTEANKVKRSFGEIKGLNYIRAVNMDEWTTFTIQKKGRP